MKSILLILTFCILQLSFLGQQRVFKQHGIRTVETIITNTRKPERSFVLKQTFDKKGNLIEEIKSEISGEIIEHTKITLEKYKKTEVKIDNSGNEIYKEISIKNKDGKTIETISENLLKQTKEIKKFSYDKWGKLVTEVWLDNKGNAERTKKYHYDKEGLLIKQVSFDENNKIIFEKEIHYEH